MCYLAHCSLNWLSVKTRVELKSGENCILFKKCRVIELFSPAQQLAYTLLIIETLQSWRFLLILFAQLRKSLSFRLYQDSSNGKFLGKKWNNSLNAKVKAQGDFFLKKVPWEAEIFVRLCHFFLCFLKCESVFVSHVPFCFSQAKILAPDTTTLKLFLLFSTVILQLEVFATSRGHSLDVA